MTRDTNATTDGTAIGSTQHKAPPAPPATEPVTDSVLRLRRGAKRLEARDLNIYYGSFKAVADLNMTVNSRSVTALIGPSGCGKSTVPRALNRLHETAPGGRVEGSVLLDGGDIYGKQISAVAVRRIVGMVFQRPNPFPTMSIRDNVVAGLKLQGTHKKNDLDELAERSLRGGEPVERGERSAGHARRGPIRWPAAAALHRPGDRRLARRIADGRTLFRA